MIFVKIIDHLFFWNHVLKITESYSERRGNIEKTSIRQYNVAIFSTSFYAIAMKKLTDRKT